MGRYLQNGVSWRSERFDASDSWVAPANLLGDVGYATGQAAGGGGCSGGVVWTAGSGSPPNDYSNGGASGQACSEKPFPVSPGDTVTITIGAAGTGGAAVVRTTEGTTNGNAGGAASDTTLAISGVTKLTLQGGAGATWATGGGGVAPVPNAAHGVTNGVDGADDTGGAVALGTSAAGADGTDDSTTKGGHAGAASYFADGTTGGNGDLATGADATGTAGAAGILGAGGAGGGSVLVNTATGFTATSGAGGDGGDGFIVISWMEEDQ